MKSVLSTYCVPDPAAAPHLRWQVTGERSERGVSEATLSYLPRWWGVLGYVNRKHTIERLGEEFPKITTLPSHPRNPSKLIFLLYTKFCFKSHLTLTPINLSYYFLKCCMINVETLSSTLSHHWNRVSFSKFQNNLSRARIRTSAGEGRGAAQDSPVWSESQRELQRERKIKLVAGVCARGSRPSRSPRILGDLGGRPRVARVWV